MFAETRHIGLKLYGKTEDKDALFLDFRDAIAGRVGSNMIKIDTAIEALDTNKADKTQVLTDIDNHDKAVGSHSDIREAIENIDVSQDIETHNTSEMAHNDIRQEIANIDVSEDIGLHNIDVDSHDDIRQDLATTNQQLNEIADKLPNNTGANNSIYRGKNLGTSVTTKQYADIINGSFEDLYIGDYWTINSINWRIAAFNYYKNTGVSAVTKNHLTLVPDTNLYTHVMNDTNITEGGYTGSKMHVEGLKEAKATIRSAFGSRLLKHGEYLSNAVVDGKASAWVEVDSEVELMTEVMVYGSVIWGESSIGGSGYNIGYGKTQLPLFALRPDLIGNRQFLWIRDVSSATSFAMVNTGGIATSYHASSRFGVRPAFSIS